MSRLESRSPADSTADAKAAFAEDRLDYASMEGAVSGALKSLSDAKVKTVDGHDPIATLNAVGPLQAISGLSPENLREFSKVFKQLSGETFGAHHIAALPEVGANTANLSNRVLHPFMAPSSETLARLKEEAPNLKKLLLALQSPELKEDDFITLVKSGRPDLVKLATRERPDQADEAVKILTIKEALKAADTHFLGHLWQAPNLEKLGQLIGGLSSQSLEELEQYSKKVYKKPLSEILAEKVAAASTDMLLSDSKLGSLSRNFSGNLGLTPGEVARAAAEDVVRKYANGYADFLYGPSRTRAVMRILETAAGSSHEDLAAIDASLKTILGANFPKSGFELLAAHQAVPAALKESLALMAKAPANEGKRSDQEVLALIDLAVKYKDKTLLCLGLKLASPELKSTTLSANSERLLAVGSTRTDRDMLHDLIMHGQIRLETLIDHSTNKIGKVGFAYLNDIAKLVKSYAADYKEEYLKGGDAAQKLDQLIDRAGFLRPAWIAARKADLRGQESLSSAILDRLSTASSQIELNQIPKLIENNWGPTEYKHFASVADFKQLRADLSTVLTSDKLDLALKIIETKAKSENFMQSLEAGQANLVESLKRSVSVRDMMIALNEATERDREEYRTSDQSKAAVSKELKRILDEHRLQSAGADMGPALVKTWALEQFVKVAQQDLADPKGSELSAYARLSMRAFLGADLKTNPQSVLDDLEAAFSENPKLLKSVNAPVDREEKIQAAILGRALAHAYFDSGQSIGDNGARWVVSASNPNAGILKTGKASVWERISLEKDPIKKLAAFSTYSTEADRKIVLAIADKGSNSSDPEIARAETRARELIRDKYLYKVVAEQGGKAMLADYVKAASGFASEDAFSQLMAKMSGRMPDISPLVEILKGADQTTIRDLNRDFASKYGSLPHPELAAVASSDKKHHLWSAFAEARPDYWQTAMKYKEDVDTRTAPLLYNWLIDKVSPARMNMILESSSVEAAQIREQMKTIEATGDPKLIEEYKSGLEQLIKAHEKAVLDSQEAYRSKVDLVQLPISLANMVLWYGIAFSAGKAVMQLPHWAKLPVGVPTKAIVLETHAFKELYMRQMAYGSLDVNDFIMTFGGYHNISMKGFFLGIGKGGMDKLAKQSAAKSAVSSF